jgi:hypothetical protein
MRYEVNPDTTLSDGKVFFDMTSAPGEDAINGIKLDQQGNRTRRLVDYFISGEASRHHRRPEASAQSRLGRR